MEPKQHRYFFTEYMDTVPLFSGFVPFFTCPVNGSLRQRTQNSPWIIFRRVKSGFQLSIDSNFVLALVLFYSAL